MPLKKKFNNRRILLVEDDVSMRRFLEIVLQRDGYEVITAEDGLAAMEVAFDETIKAVVSDAVMPNLTGYDLCRILRQNPKTEKVPIIILSGLEKKDEEISRENEADAYLTKNKNISEELLEKLRELLDETSNPS